MEPREQFMVMAFEVALRSVESGDGGPFGAVVVRGDGGEAAASDGRHAAPFRLDAAARLRVIGRRDEVLVAGPHLER